MAQAPADPVSLHRRRFLKSGVSAGLAGASGWNADAAPDLAAFRRAGIDWRAFAGQKLVLGAIEHPWTAAITPLLPVFEQLTGIAVRVLKQSEGDYVAAMSGRMATQASTPDVLMVYALGTFISSGWLAPLDPYYADGKLFDARWFDADDVFPAARLIPSWPDGQQYSQSITMEVQLLFANGRMLAQAGEALPQTFEQLQRAAVRSKTSAHAGISLRCKAEGGTMWVLAGFIFSNGGAIVDSGACVFDSDAAAGGVEAFVRLLREAGPRPVNHDWYEALRDFGQGAAALCIDSSHWATELANAQATPVAADVLYAPMPGNGQIPAQPNVWAWQAGINRHSAHKQAAFLLLSFLNSSPACQLSGANGLATPRPSAWASPDFQQRADRRAVQATLASAKAGATTKFKAVWQHPKCDLVLDALAKAVHGCVTDGGDVRAALRAQASAVNRALANKR
jgi:multiple sugar transport system substrate-binding protein